MVEDNPDTALTSALLIRSMGHEVVTAESGLAAGKLARMFRPELVFVDLVLPDMDGCDVAKELISELGSAAKVYIVTAYSDDRARRRAKEAGCSDYFLKPLSTMILESLLR